MSQSSVSTMSSTDRAGVAVFAAQETGALMVVLRGLRDLGIQDAEYRMMQRVLHNRIEQLAELSIDALSCDDSDAEATARVSEALNSYHDLVGASL